MEFTTEDIEKYQPLKFTVKEAIGKRGSISNILQTVINLLDTTQKDSIFTLKLELREKPVETIN